MTRRRTRLTASLANLTRWKWSTTIVAFGNNPSVRNAAAYTAAGSIATYSTASRNCGVRALGQPFDHGGAGAAGVLSHQPLLAVQIDEPGVPRIHPHPPLRFDDQYSHLGLPRRLSSIPNTRTGSGSTSRASACSMKARCAVGHDTRCAAATSDTDRAASPTAGPIWARSRRVVRARGGTSVIDSVNDPTSQDACWHLHRVLHQRTSGFHSRHKECPSARWGAVRSSPTSTPRHTTGTSPRHTTGTSPRPHRRSPHAPSECHRPSARHAQHEHPPTRTNLS